eukprot:6368105-Lingulodinium_polyedra.AAC.1
MSGYYLYDHVQCVHHHHHHFFKNSRVRAIPPSHCTAWCQLPCPWLRGHLMAFVGPSSMLRMMTSVAACVASSTDSWGVLVVRIGDMQPDSDA